MAAALPVIASVVGIGSGVKNLTSRPQQGGSGSTSTYIPTGLGDADKIFQSILGKGTEGSLQAGSQINPAIASAFAKYLGIDPSNMIANAQRAGQGYQDQIAPAINAEGNLLTNAGNIARAGNQLYQTSFDPENELRNRYQQQLTDASRSATSSRGIGMGGEAAGIEQQGVSNFLQDWQDRQLGRQATGLQGLGNAYNQAGRDYAGGLAAGALAPGYAQAAGSVPYGAQIQAARQPFDAANLYSGALGGSNQNMAGWLQQIIPYLNAGLGATGQGFNQGQAGLGNIFQGAYNLGGQGGATPWSALANIFSQPNFSNYGNAGGGPGQDQFGGPGGDSGWTG